MIIVADTSPINYLILIHEIDVLPKMYGSVLIPRTVRDELVQPSAPQLVRSWIEHLPIWFEVRNPLAIPDPSLAKLDAEAGNKMPIFARDSRRLYDNFMNLLKARS